MSNTIKSLNKIRIEECLMDVVVKIIDNFSEESFSRKFEYRSHIKIC